MKLLKKTEKYILKGDWIYQTILLLILLLILGKLIDPIFLRLTEIFLAIFIGFVMLIVIFSEHLFPED